MTKDINTSDIFQNSPQSGFIYAMLNIKKDELMVLAYLFLIIGIIMWAVFFILLFPFAIRYLTIPLAGFKTEYMTAFRATLVPSLTAAAIGLAFMFASDFNLKAAAAAYLIVSISLKTYSYSNKICSPDKGIGIGYGKGFFLAFLSELYFILSALPNTLFRL